MCQSDADVFSLMTALPRDLGVIDLKFTSKSKFEFSLLKKKVRFIFHSKAEQYLQPGPRFLFHSQRGRWRQIHLGIKGFSLVNFLRKSWSKIRRYCLSTGYVNRPNIFKHICKGKVHISGHYLHKHSSLVYSLACCTLDDLLSDNWMLLPCPVTDTNISRVN